MSNSGTNFESLIGESVNVAEKLNRLPIHATITTSATLVAGQLTPANAEAGEIVATLPTGKTEGTLIAVEKTDSSTNIVKVSGSIRGEAATDSLKLKRESVLYEAEASGSWRPIADRKTLGSMDERYIRQTGENINIVGALASRNNKLSLRDFFSTADYGTLGEGSHEDGAKINEAITKAFEGEVGRIWMPANKIFLTEVTIALRSKVELCGQIPNSVATPASLIRQAPGANLNALVATYGWVHNEAETSGKQAGGVRWLGVDVNRTAQTGGEGHGIVLARYRDYAIECAVWRPEGDAIRATNVMQGGSVELTSDTPEIKIKGNIGYNMKKHGGSVIEGSHTGVITDGFMENNVFYTEEPTVHEGDGIHMAQSGGWSVINNHPYGIGGSNIYCDQCSMTRIALNEIDGWGSRASAGNVYGIYARVRLGGGVAVIGNTGYLTTANLGAGNTSTATEITTTTGAGRRLASVAGNTFAASTNVGAGTGLSATLGSEAKLSLANVGANAYSGFSTNKSVATVESEENTTGVWRGIAGASGGGLINSAAVAGTYALFPGQGGATAITANGLTVGDFYFDPVSYEVPGKTTKCRLSVVCLTPETASTITHTVGLYPIETMTGAVINLQQTVGTVVSGSTVKFENQAKEEKVHKYSSEFAAPSAGLYALGDLTSALNTTNCRTGILASLEIHWI